MAVITRFSFGAPILVAKNTIPAPIGKADGWSGVAFMPSPMDAIATMPEEEWDAIALKPLKKGRA